MDGFLLIDKPAGWTSHDVVARVRRLAGQKRVGHTGTLDPDATGVLIVCLGFATRLIEYTDGHTKVYNATVALGVETDSQDGTGAVTARRDAGGVTNRDLASVLPRFRGQILQVPPMVSAVHHEGRRLYEIAREGGFVERSPRPVTIHRLEATVFVPGTVAYASLEVECSGGTYIRTLCADIGDALGCGGHMASLRRTRVGPFGEECAIPLERLADEGVAAHLHPAAALLPPAWPIVECEEETACELGHGKPIPASGAGDMAIALSQGRVLAVLARSGDSWRPAKVFPTEDR